eukprot:m.929136 g.929136  ORF g.929136 m.929136 type:complete len:53 (+) comp23781_c0_seq8:1903-2061(+)
MYVENEDPGRERLQVYHDCFTSTPHPMDSGFVHTVTKNFVAQMHAYDTRDAK